MPIGDLRFQPDCSNCVNACCVIPERPERLFPGIGEKWGSPCKKLCAEGGCSIHSILKGQQPNCSLYSCRGAGQIFTKILKKAGFINIQDARERNLEIATCLMMFFGIIEIICEMLNEMNKFPSQQKKVDEFYTALNNMADAISETNTMNILLGKVCEMRQIHLALYQHSQTTRIPGILSSRAYTRSAAVFESYKKAIEGMLERFQKNSGKRLIDTYINCCFYLGHYFTKNPGMPKKLADQSHHVLHLGAKTYILNSVIPLFDELKDNPEIVEDFLDTLAVGRLPGIVLTTMEK